MAASPVYRVAVVGGSGIAPAHLHGLRLCPHAEPGWIVSRDMARAREFGERFGVEPVAEYGALLESGDVDAVHVVTEPARHVELALQAVRAGKHVLIEKPLDVDAAKARELLDAVRESGLAASVISQRRFDPDLVRMKERLDAGEIGKPLLADVKMVWRKSVESYRAGSGWKSRYGNVLINHAVHWLDVLVWFFGAPDGVRSLLRRERPELECYDTAVACLHYGKGPLATLACTTAANDPEQPESITLHGDAGSLACAWPKPRGLKSRVRGKAGRLLGSGQEKTAMERQIDDFYESLARGREPRTPLRDSYEVLRIIQTCEQDNASFLSSL